MAPDKTGASADSVSHIPFFKTSNNFKYLSFQTFQLFSSAHFLPASLEIKPEKELRELSFNFPIASPDQYLDKKPYAYIAQLLGHEGKGSLLSLLKRLGWADALTAQVRLQNRSDAIFQINITLTARGLKARDQIMSLVFHCIEQLRSRGLNSWRYGELQQLADMQFRFGEK